MKFVVKVSGDEVFFDSLKDILKSEYGHLFALVNDKLILKTRSLSERFFIYSSGAKVVISDNLKRAVENVEAHIYPPSIEFYKKYGFIIPPFTQYKNVYLTVPNIAYKIGNTITFDKVMPSFSHSRSDSSSALQDSLITFFKGFLSNKLTLLVSGGIDSSALLGFLSNHGKVKSSVMCKMSSLPDEGKLAQSLSEKVNVPFKLIDLDLDLTDRAVELISETGELISDPISVIFPEVFDQLGGMDQVLYLVDGQGADSLLNGLPLNKVFNLWGKLKYFRYLLLPLTLVPVYKDKSTPLKRKIYRITKAIKSISQIDFRKSILSVMTESEGDGGLLESYFLEDIKDLHCYFDDWHTVIRYIYLYRVLPAREMQKYLLADKYNIKIVAPFLDERVIKTLFSISNDQTINKGLYKFPITKMAQTYWPGYFETSKTSPFQVNFKIGTTDLKQYSIDFVNKNVIK